MRKNNKRILSAGLVLCMIISLFSQVAYAEGGSAFVSGQYETVLGEAIEPEMIAQAALNVVYTPLHGTGLLPVREVLSHMQGVHVTEVEAQGEPDGAFPTCPKPNPELDETLAMGIALAKETGADMLLATDPDCDRVGVAVRDAQGEYHRLSGNEVGLLLAEYVLRTRKLNGTTVKQQLLG